MYCTWAILLFDTREYLSLCWAAQPPSKSRSDFGGASRRIPLCVGKELLFRDSQSTEQIRLRRCHQFRTAVHSSDSHCSLTQGWASR